MDGYEAARVRCLYWVWWARADSEPRREQVVLARSTTPTLRQHWGNCGWVGACPTLCPFARPLARTWLMGGVLVREALFCPLYFLGRVMSGSGYCISLTVGNVSVVDFIVWLAFTLLFLIGELWRPRGVFMVFLRACVLLQNPRGGRRFPFRVAVVKCRISHIISVTSALQVLQGFSGRDLNAAPIVQLEQR